ncbi:MAG TPA: Fe-S cluster assembly protein SufD [Steroidobacteraceae bacterium]|nr:Fe-S cluster assembly protein SufD [Steroidobacteraceae bacterium]
MLPAPQPVSPALRSFAGQWHTRTPDSLAPLREQAMQRFMKLGLPGMRDESWRYTNLRSLASRTFVDAPRRDGSEIEPNASLSLVGESERAASLLMVNGHPSIPYGDGFIKGLEINTLADLAKHDPQMLRAYLEQPSDPDLSRFALLNTALFIDGLHLRITEPLAVPLIVLHVATGDGVNNVAYPRVIIHAAPGAAATIVEHHVSQGRHAPLVASHTHLVLDKGARVEHYRVFATAADSMHLDSLQIRQLEESCLKQFTIALGGGLVRAGLEAELARPGASLDQFSLLVGHGERHVDCANVVTHAATDTASAQTARAIAGDSSRVVFNSKVVVNRGALRSESKQSCRGLLLSPHAEIDTRPQLEIHADEVKASHGATTGRLDPDMLFYLLSRGLDRETAQALLVYAFLADVLTGMSMASARSAIEGALIAQLPDSQTLRNFR